MEFEAKQSHSDYWQTFTAPSFMDAAEDYVRSSYFAGSQDSEREVMVRRDGVTRTYTVRVEFNAFLRSSAIE